MNAPVRGAACFYAVKNIRVGHELEFIASVSSLIPRTLLYWNDGPPRLYCCFSCLLAHHALGCWQFFSHFRALTDCLFDHYVGTFPVTGEVFEFGYYNISSYFPTREQGSYLIVNVIISEQKYEWFQEVMANLPCVDIQIHEEEVMAQYGCEQAIKVERSLQLKLKAEDWLAVRASIICNALCHLRQENLDAGYRCPTEDELTRLLKIDCPQADMALLRQLHQTNVFDFDEPQKLAEILAHKHLGTTSVTKMVNTVALPGADFV